MQEPSDLTRPTSGIFRDSAKAPIVRKPDKRSELTCDLKKVVTKFDKQNKEIMFRPRISRPCTGAGGGLRTIPNLDPSDSGQTHETPRFSPEGRHRIGLGDAAVEDGDFFPVHTFATQTLAFLLH